MRDDNGELELNVPELASLDVLYRRGRTPFDHRQVAFEAPLSERMRKLEPKSQETYIRTVRKLSVYLKRPPDTATVEDLRNFQLHLVDTGTSPVTLNATLAGLKFYFDLTLVRGELMARMQPVKLP